jgi:NAD-dependent protein deacetylases, SIR2 family
MIDLTLNFTKIIKTARKVVVLTGAGVSKESGLDTFRDVGGYWSKYNPYELASPQGFLNNPLLVWQWYQARRNKAKEAQPNPGHLAIAQMEKIFPEFFLFTQNVDGLHFRAGSKKVYELHGNIFSSHCFSCGVYYDQSFEIGDSIDTIPRCPRCNGLIRPSVVWFGESLPADVLNLAYQQTRTCNLFFTIGTFNEVYPAADLPYQAKSSGAFIVEINPNETSFTRYADLSYREKSGEILPKILQTIKEIRSQ